jgi:hypothetical protein
MLGLDPDLSPQTCIVQSAVLCVYIAKHQRFRG